VTHQLQADSPLASKLNLRGYALRVESDTMTVNEASFINVGSGATNSAAAGKRWVYLSGRFVSPFPNLLRLVDLAGNSLTSGLEGVVNVTDSRGIAVGSAEDRVYLLARNPDTLLVVKIIDPLSDVPGVRLLQAVRLPNSPSELKVLPRAGRGDLVAITCTGAGVLALYDDDVGDLVAQVGALGQQPFGIDADFRGDGVRLFVSTFTDGRVAVVEVPDLARPQGARLVAHVGPQQLCLTRAATTAGCTEVAP
jgi:hypothetical protein